MWMDSFLAAATLDEKYNPHNLKSNRCSRPLSS